MVAENYWRTVTRATPRVVTNNRAPCRIEYFTVACCVVTLNRHVNVTHSQSKVNLQIPISNSLQVQFLNLARDGVATNAQFLRGFNAAAAGVQQRSLNQF